MIVIAAGFIPDTPMPIVSEMVKYGEAAIGLERILCGIMVKRVTERHV